MLVDWKYIYKRRKWSTKLIFESLEEKTWENFEAFHSSRGIEVPPKEEFEKLILTPAPKTQVKPKPKKVKAPEAKKTAPPEAKRKRTYSRKKKGS